MAKNNKKKTKDVALRCIGVKYWIGHCNGHLWMFKILISVKSLHKKILYSILKYLWLINQCLQLLSFESQQIDDFSFVKN